jgi:hypothetical protein
LASLAAIINQSIYMNRQELIAAVIKVNSEHWAQDYESKILVDKTLIWALNRRCDKAGLTGLFTILDNGGAGRFAANIDYDPNTGKGFLPTA